MIASRRLAFALLLYPGLAAAQPQAPATDASPKAITEQLNKLRSLPDNTRAGVTKQLALQIRDLPRGSKLSLAMDLSSLSTEGDFGRDVLQEVTTTLEQALRESPVGPTDSGPDSAYLELAELARYEGMRVVLDDPQYAAAQAKLEAYDRDRRKADFTLTDLQGRSWTLKNLRGKVVLVNFWATWCPPCRKEMPDLNALYTQFGSRGLVILAISDEPAETVKPFIAQKQKVGYPILLNPDKTVAERFHVVGIPKSFVFDRDGQLVAQSIDMRTMKQFLDMLGKAGLR